VDTDRVVGYTRGSFWPSDDTRLQTLEDATSSPVRCRLSYTSLCDEDRREYHALSYCWEQSEGAKTIIVDGQNVTVTANLEAALRQLRGSTSVYLWVDALCINQSDVHERATQVSRMGKIYARASCVLAWLGTGSPAAAAAMTCMKRTEKLEGAKLQPRDMARTQNAGQTIPRDRWNQLLDDPRRRPSTTNPQSRLRKDFGDFFGRPYWQRKWIIQEVAKGTEVQVICGGSRASLDLVLRFGLSVYGAALLDDVAIETLLAIHIFRKRENPMVLGAPRMLLSEALRRTRYALATEPQDAIYAVLGLTRDGDDVVPMPNYRQPLAAVLGSVSRKMIDEQGQTALTLLARSQAGRTPDLPSWSPDWTQLPRHIAPWITWAVEQKQRNRLHSANSRNVRRHSNRGALLSVHGRVLDCVAAVGKTRLLETPERNIWSAAGKSAPVQQLCLAHPGWHVDSVLASLWDCLVACIESPSESRQASTKLTTSQKAFAVGTWWTTSFRSRESISAATIARMRDLQYCECRLLDWVLSYLALAKTRLRLIQHFLLAPRLKSSLEAAVLVDQGYCSGDDVDTFVPAIRPIEEIHTEPMQARPMQARPMQARPMQARPMQARPMQAQPMQGDAIDRIPTRRKRKRQSDDLGLTDRETKRSSLLTPVAAAVTPVGQIEPLDELQMRAAHNLLDQAMEQMQMHRMQLGVTGYGNFELLYDQARVGDLICRIDNCILPVILRPQPGLVHTYVGEVCRPCSYQEDVAVTSNKIVELMIL
jgi:hypothetical protein